MSTEANSEPVTVDHDVIRSLAASWPRRATVRGERYTFTNTPYEDPALSDYPLDLVPFKDHPRFQELDADVRQKILTWGWMAYNDRTVTLEERLANPAFALIMHDAFEGADDIELRKAVQQCLLDEHFHTYMHMVAMEDTRRFRGLDAFKLPTARPARQLQESLARAESKEHQAYIGLAYGVVAELSVKEFLDLLSTDRSIQPAHRTIALLHNRDEAAHGRLLGEVAKVLWLQMNARQRGYFAAAMPDALDAFVAQDFSTWQAILEHVGVTHAEEIIQDVSGRPSLRNVVTKVREIKQLLGELDLLERIQEAEGMGFLAA